MIELPLRTARLELRAFTLDDAPAAHAIYADPDVMAHVGHGPVGDIRATEAMLREYIAHQDEHGYSFWAVIERASGALIGDTGLYSLTDREVEVGYTLGRAWWGRGYATEAASACVQAGFSGAGLDEIVAVADAANAASLRVLEKLGMERVGARAAYGRPHVLYRLRHP